MTNIKTIKSSSQKKSLYTDQEKEIINKLIEDFDNEIIDLDEFDKLTRVYIRLCEDRKNHIRYNNITKEDKKNGFIPEDFPYLTVFSKKYYPEKYWLELQNLNPNELCKK
jgi:hypothetical protein